MICQFNSDGTINLVGLTPSQVKQIQIATERHRKLAHASTPTERSDNNKLCELFDTVFKSYTRFIQSKKN